MPDGFASQEGGGTSHVESADVNGKMNVKVTAGNHRNHQLRTAAQAKMHLLRRVNKQQRLLFSSRSICLHNMQI